MALQEPCGNPAALDTQFLDRTIAAAIGWLERHQTTDGYWQGALESNPSMEAEWVLAMHLIGVHDDPKYDGVVQSLLNRQRADGSWENYYQAPAGDISTTVECYLALRVAGHSADEQPLRRALAWIRERGGVTRVRVFTKYWLAMLGEWPWDELPGAAAADHLPAEVAAVQHLPVLELGAGHRGADAELGPTGRWCAARRQRLDELFPSAVTSDYRCRAARVDVRRGPVPGARRGVRWLYRTASGRGRRRRSRPA